MDDTKVIYAGYLKKSPPERRLWRTWHKRYFVLKSNKTLTYYPNEKDTRPVKDPVDLRQCLSIEANLRHNNKSFKYVFSINTTNRVYYLVAESQNEMEKWVNLLCKECGFEKQDDKSSPDFLLKKSSPKQTKSHVQTVYPSPLTPSPPATCPLSQSMPMLTKCRAVSDPPDSAEIIKRAEEQYKTATLERRRSTGVPSREHLTLPVRGPDLSRVPECYDTVPPPKPTYSSRDLASPQRPPKRRDYSEVDGGYTSLAQPSPRSPVDSYDIVPPRRRSTCSTDYDIVPKPRPASQATDDESLYDIPPLLRNSNVSNYDFVPPPRPASENDPSQLYDYVPNHNPEEMYDSLPPRHMNCEDETYDVPPREAYDIVPPPRPTTQLIDTADCYDTLPPAGQDNEIYDTPPAFSARNNQEVSHSPPPRPPKPSDDVYDVPPKLNTPDQESDIYDIPPKPSDSDIYDILPSRSETDDIYDVPPTQAALSPPSVDRSSKPPSVDRSNKPEDHDYTNMAPPVNRKIKPPVSNHDICGQHSYVNLLPPVQRAGSFSKNQSLPETFDVPNMPIRNQKDVEYYNMQPYRSDETRCYSFSKDKVRKMSDREAYEEMEPVKTSNRESGVHSNSSSSEDGEEDCYMVMSSPGQNAKSSQRSASLQYCEVQIVEGQSKCQMPVSKRGADSHYTTINEESTKAFLQTCRQHELSQKK
ncbi:GRB2-associated-binding protein 1-like isoform X2 [Actinia tenebrosa]|uniref:GRB2-associated-binding protein 1-like isoform X2 n=1 Tax=Actinia tenebrosa TaxID=6105 RepID=A0A6P8IC21_ACTTE|nr:GRB2-associated-binding protein 1-like isoform X2 [Actinia tenebrosa]